MRIKSVLAFMAALAFMILTPGQSYAASYYSTVNSNYGNALCMGANTADGFTVEKQSCGADWNKQWWFENDTYTRVVNRWNGECLDGGGSNYVPVSVEPCSSTNDYQWWWYNSNTGQLVNTQSPSLCLDFDTDTDYVGGRVWMLPCNGSPAQSFWRNTTP